MEKNGYVEIHFFIVKVGYRLTSYYSYGIGKAMQLRTYQHALVFLYFSLRYK
jgi:hypothetical protein